MPGLVRHCFIFFILGCTEYALYNNMSGSCKD